MKYLDRAKKIIVVNEEVRLLQARLNSDSKASNPIGLLHHAFYYFMGWCMVGEFKPSEELLNKASALFNFANLGYINENNRDSPRKLYATLQYNWLYASESLNYPCSMIQYCRQAIEEVSTQKDTIRVINEYFAYLIDLGDIDYCINTFISLKRKVDISKPFDLSTYFYLKYTNGLDTENDTKLKKVVVKSLMKSLKQEALDNNLLFLCVMFKLLSNAEPGASARLAIHEYSKMYLSDLEVPDF